MGVQPTGIGHDPDPGRAERVRLRPDAGPRLAERGAVGGDAGDGDDARPVSVREGGQVLAAGLELGAV